MSLGSTPLLARAPGDNGRSSREPKLLKVCCPAARARSPCYLKESGELAAPRSSFLRVSVVIVSPSESNM